MELPEWMRIGDKALLPTLGVWGLLFLLLLGLALAVWGSFSGGSNDLSF